MSSKALDDHIQSTPETAGGRPRIRGRRITVQDIAIWHERLGKGADEMAAEYDLTLADVYAALAYYFDHREEIDAVMTEDRAFAETLRARTPYRRDQKLRALRAWAALRMESPSTEVTRSIWQKRHELINTGRPGSPGPSRGR